MNLHLSSPSPIFCASLHLKSTLVSTDKVKFSLIILSAKNHQQSKRGLVVSNCQLVQLTPTLYFMERISWKFSHHCFKKFHTLSTNISTLALKLGAQWPKITSGHLMYTFKEVFSGKQALSKTLYREHA